jgi:hypothetical protein
MHGQADHLLLDRHSSKARTPLALAAPSTLCN